jgi:hypothetical protein
MTCVSLESRLSSSLVSDSSKNAVSCEMMARKSCYWSWWTSRCPTSVKQ